MSMASASLTRRSRCTNVWEANKASAYCTSINDDEDEEEEEEDASDIRSKEQANHEEPTSSGSKSDEVVIECCCCCCILLCLDWTFRRTFLDWNSIRN